MPFSDPIQVLEDGVKIYENPKDNHIYTMCVDVSRGQGIDYHAATVIDVTSAPYKLVATVRNNELPPMVLPTLINRIGKKYNDAYCLIEVNDIGGQVADILYSEIEYENVLYTSVRGHRGQQLGAGFGPNSRIGVKTSTATKRVGCSSLKAMVEEDQLVIPDYDTITELSTFIAKANSYAADSGHHDDLVMTLVIFGWMTSQPYFKDLTDVNIREAMFQEKINKLEDNLTPFGLIDDGLGRDDYEVDSEGDVWFTDESSPWR